ncbi:MAG TPA: ribonuclease H-like domain-containing protein [Terriglobia bacterium]
MNLEEKLRALRQAAEKSSVDCELERQLEWLRRRQAATARRPLPAQRVPRGIEHYVEGCLEQNQRGEYFVARQSLPFGRPYGKLRVGDVSVADLRALEIFLEDNPLPDPAELIYLDTETTGLAGGTGTCAFLIGIGYIEGSDFVVRQFFLRDYPEEKAILAALAEILIGYKGLVTFNGKTFDVPLLETRYTLARHRSPFGRMIHLDLLHPARRLWKLRLESCQLTHLEKEVLGISRNGDVAGAEIPGIYFDYLRTGDARGLQPVFYHNALDIVTLAALTSELARIIRNEMALATAEAPEALEPAEAAAASACTHSLDLFSLSRIFERAGNSQESASICRRALALGLPPSLESRALWHLAAEHKRRSEYPQAIEIWEEMVRREAEGFLEALEQLALHAEHRLRDAQAARQYTEKALAWLSARPNHRAVLQPRDHGQAWPAWAKPEGLIETERFMHRLQRLRRKLARAGTPIPFATRPGE